MNPYLITLSIFLTSTALQSQDIGVSTLAYRDEWKQSMLSDPRSPLDSSDLQFVTWFEPDSAYSIPFRFEKLTEAIDQQIPTYSGNQKNFRPYGKLLFIYLGKLHTLTVYQSISSPALASLGDYLFLPFKDYSNGDLTYGGGRYLDIRKSSLEDGTFKLDFNKAYNPWCAYSSGFNCPIPPVENHLPFAVYAGEKMYAGGYKQNN